MKMEQIFEESGIDFKALVKRKRMDKWDWLLIIIIIAVIISAICFFSGCASQAPRGGGAAAAGSLQSASGNKGEIRDVGDHSGGDMDKSTGDKAENDLDKSRAANLTPRVEDSKVKDLTQVPVSTGDIGQGGGLWVVMVSLGVCAILAAALVKLGREYRFYKESTFRIAGAVKNGNPAEVALIKHRVKACMPAVDRKQLDKRLRRRGVYAEK